MQAASLAIAAAMMRSPSDLPAAEKFDPTSAVWCDEPTARFNDGLPLGDGRLGMILGGVPPENESCSAKSRSGPGRLLGTTAPMRTST